MSNAHAQNAAEFGAGARRHFLLSPDITYLNHGAFGATPQNVMDRQHALQKKMEADPSWFFEWEFRPAMREIAAKLAEYLNTAGKNIAMIENATLGVNAVLRSLDFGPGDEILICNQTYGAVKNAAAYVAERTGATLTVADLPFPAESNAQIVEAFAAGLSDKTKIAIIDHVVSPTALLLPMKEMAKRARDAGALVLIDGAHAPGMVEIDFSELDVDWYTGNCHKWLFAPKGCAFLWTADKHLEATHPLVISHYYQDGYGAEFDWVGTRDGTAQMALPTAMRFRERFGDAAIKSHNHDLVIQAAAMLAEAWGTEMGAPDELFGSMATIRLPGNFTPSLESAQEVRSILVKDHKIQSPIRHTDEHLWVRISAQIYNEMADYERLASAMLEMTKK